jgi:hypothetical protein
MVRTRDNKNACSGPYQYVDINFEMLLHKLDIVLI